LRGYGNAIVPQVGALVVEAFLAEERAMIPALDVLQPEAAQALAPDLARDVDALATRLADYPVATRDDAEAAVRERAGIGAMRKTVEDFFAPIKAAAYKLHREICDRERAITSKLDARDRSLGVALSAWKVAEDTRRRAAEQAAQEAARRDQHTVAVAEASALEAEGQQALAEAVVADAIATPPPVVALPDPVRAVPGLKYRKVWKWKYTGGPADVKQTTVQTIARTMQLIPREFLTVDESKVGAYVRSMKASGSIPGIEIYVVEEPVR
jgi:hypothetical protein